MKELDVVIWLCKKHVILEKINDNEFRIATLRCYIEDFENVDKFSFIVNKQDLKQL